MKVTFDNSDSDRFLSSYVWICTSTHSASKVTVIDARNPALILDSFPVCQTHLLCICSIQGASEKDYTILENSEVTKSGEIFVKPGNGADNFECIEYIKIDKNTNNNQPSVDEKIVNAVTKQHENVEIQTPPKNYCNAVVEDLNIPASSPINLKKPSIQSARARSHEDSAYPKPSNPILRSENPLEDPIMSSMGPTMWLGAQNGMLYVHSAVSRWRECLHKIQLPDAVLSVVYVLSRVVVALANGKVAIFKRKIDGEWDISSYHLITLGSPQHSVRCLCIVEEKIWAAHRNKIHVIDPISLCILHTLEAHPRKESQVRQVVTTGLGVWVSIRYVWYTLVFIY